MTLFKGTGDPPKGSKRLRSALIAYHYTEPSDRDPALERGRSSLTKHVDQKHQKPSQPAKPGTGSVPRGQQSALNWAATLALEINSYISAPVASGTGRLLLQGAQVWSGQPLTGNALKQEALQTQARVAAVKDPGQVMEIVSQAESVELMFALDFGIDIEAHSETVELLSLVTWVLAGPLYELKRQFKTPRPHQVPGVTFDPLIAVPGHASFPGGHAAAAYAIAAVLGEITKASSLDRARLLAIADRISSNRIDAGLHTDSDTVSGKALGLALGAWLVSASLRNKVTEWGTLYSEARKEW
jgi:hypothetical protein